MSLQPNVTLLYDSSADRCQTVTGFSLAWLVIVRLLFWGSLLGFLFALFIHSPPLRRLQQASVIVGMMFCAIIPWFILAMVIDYRRKIPLAVKYGINVRFGSDATQRRTFSLVGAPEDIQSLIQRVIT